MIYLFIFYLANVEYELFILVIGLRTSWETMIFCKSLCVEWTAVRVYNYLTKLVFDEKRTDSSYPVHTLGKLWTFVKQGWSFAIHYDLIYEPFGSKLRSVVYQEACIIILDLGVCTAIFSFFDGVYGKWRKLDFVLY